MVSFLDNEKSPSIESGHGGSGRSLLLWFKVRNIEDQTAEVFARRHSADSFCAETHERRDWISSRRYIHVRGLQNEALSRATDAL